MPRSCPWSSMPLSSRPQPGGAFPETGLRSRRHHQHHAPGAQGRLEPPGCSRSHHWVSLYPVSRLSHSPPRLCVNPKFAPGIWPDVRMGRTDRGRYIPNVQLDRALWGVTRQPLSGVFRPTITGAVTVAAPDAGPRAETTRVIFVRAPATWLRQPVVRLQYR